MDKVKFKFPDEEDTDTFDVEDELDEDESLEEEESEEESDETKEPEGEPEIEVEVVDDVDPKDRNRKPVDPPEDITEEELKQHGKKVQNRLKKFSAGYHEERRAKEAALREKEELERITSKLLEENKQLRGNVNKNQTSNLELAKRVAKSELEKAEASYRDAHERGDTEAVLKAQKELIQAQNKVDKINNFKVTPLQEEEVDVKREPQFRSEQPAVDEKAVAWAKKNPWFKTNNAMTGYAYGLHAELVKEQGVDPRSDEYYRKLDAGMRKVFPDYFGEKESSTSSNPPRRKSVVAPATRSSSRTKIKLTATQAKLAQKYGLTLEQYAKEFVAVNGDQNG